jgi:hypothetical protein
VFLRVCNTCIWSLEGFISVFILILPHVPLPVSPVICSFVSRSVGQSRGEEATGAAIRYQISRSPQLMTMMTQTHLHTDTYTRNSFFFTSLLLLSCRCRGGLKEMFTVHTSRITTRRTTAAFSDLLLLIPLVGLYAWAGSTRRRGEEDSWLFNQNHHTTVVEEGEEERWCRHSALRWCSILQFIYLFIYLYPCTSRPLIQTSLIFSLEFLLNTRWPNSTVPLQYHLPLCFFRIEILPNIRQANAASEFDRI